jgi:hypothetical protein
LNETAVSDLTSGMLITITINTTCINTINTTITITVIITTASYSSLASTYSCSTAPLLSHRDVSLHLFTLFKQKDCQFGTTSTRSNILRTSPVQSCRIQHLAHEAKPAPGPTSCAHAQHCHAGSNNLRMEQYHRQIQHSALCIVIDAVALTSNVLDQAAIAMAFLRAEIALIRAQIDAEKQAAATQKATNDALREENGQYDEHQEQLRQELAELDVELSVAHAVTVAEQQEGSALLEVRKDWDPEYLARLAPTTVTGYPETGLAASSASRLALSGSSTASSSSSTTIARSGASDNTRSDAEISGDDDITIFGQIDNGIASESSLVSLPAFDASLQPRFKECLEAGRKFPPYKQKRKECDAEESSRDAEDGGDSDDDVIVILVASSKRQKTSSLPADSAPPQ